MRATLWRHGLSRGRLRLRLAAVACVLVTCGGGCTALISFDDQPSCDGGLCPDDASIPLADASHDGAGAHDGARDGASDGPTLPDGYAPCQGLPTGYYCALDGLKGYVGPSSDLVTCDGGAVYAVKHCGDAGCLAMPNPFPDCCNECNTKADGTYCGRDFPGFPAANADMLVSCQAGNASQQYACPHGCKSSGTAASCYP